MPLAPARLKASRLSIIARSLSSMPAFTAAFPEFGATFASNIRDLYPDGTGTHSKLLDVKIPDITAPPRVDSGKASLLGFRKASQLEPDSRSPLKGEANVTAAWRRGVRNK